MGGLDISASEVRCATERVAQKGLPADRCHFIVGDMEQLPMGEAVFDVVISNGGFCLCPDKERSFREIYRVLKPGGRISIACTVLRAPLPDLSSTGRRWPPCMEVFMLRSTIEPVLSDIGFIRVGVDDS